MHLAVSQQLLSNLDREEIQTGKSLNKASSKINMSSLVTRLSYVSFPWQLSAQSLDKETLQPLLRIANHMPGNVQQSTLLNRPCCCGMFVQSYRCFYQRIKYLHCLHRRPIGLELVLQEEFWVDVLNNVQDNFFYLRVQRVFVVSGVCVRQRWDTYENR